MQKFTMTCSCGDPMTVDAADRNDAVMQLKAMMTESSIKAHMEEKHPGDPIMSVAECHAAIERDVQPAM